MKIIGKVTLILRNLQIIERNTFCLPTMPYNQFMKRLFRQEADLFEHGAAQATGKWRVGSVFSFGKGLDVVRAAVKEVEQQTECRVAFHLDVGGDIFHRYLPCLRVLS